MKILGEAMQKNIFTICLFFISVCCFAENVAITSITASSTLQSQSNLYDVTHLIDGSELSWVEGETDAGIGTQITINFEKKIELKTFYIKNGYGDFEHYYTNNRVKALRCEFQSRGAADVVLEDKPGFQKVEFDIPVSTNKLILTINEVYKGSKYNDTAIAEINFGDWERLDHDEINMSIIGNRIDDIYQYYKEKDSLITNRVNKSFFASPRYDARHGEDWFLVSCGQQIIPLMDGGLYLISSLSSEFMGQQQSSKYGDDYILFSKFKDGKLIPCQNEFITLGNKADIQELQIQKDTLPETEKDFFEKHIAIFNDLEASRESNLPFLSTLYEIRVWKTVLSIHQKITSNTSKSLPQNIRDLYPNFYDYEIKYHAPTEIITKVSLP